MYPQLTLIWASMKPVIADLSSSLLAVSEAGRSLRDTGDVRRDVAASTAHRDVRRDVASSAHVLHHSTNKVKRHVINGRSFSSPRSTRRHLISTILRRRPVVV